MRALTLLLTLPSPSPCPLLQRFPQVCWDWLLARAARLHSRQRGVQQRQRAPFVNLPALGASRSLSLFCLSAYLLPLWPALPVALPGRPCASFKHPSPLFQQSIFPLPAAVDVAQHRRCWLSGDAAPLQPGHPAGRQAAAWGGLLWWVGG